MSKYLPFNLFVRQALLYPLTSPFLPPIAKVEKDYSYANASLIGTLAGGAVLHTGQTVSHNTGDDGNNDGTAKSYTDNGDGTVTDNQTGLMWQKDHYSNGAALSYADALAYAKAATTGTYTNWRVPSISELVSLIDYNYPSDTPLNAIFTAVGLMTNCTGYWSCTSVPNNTGNAFAWVNSDCSIAYENKFNPTVKCVRCVRTV